MTNNAQIYEKHQRFGGVGLVNEGPPKTGRGQRIADDPHGIKAWRKRLGLSQRALAELAGTDHTRVGSLESSTPSGKVSASTVLPAVMAALESYERQKKGDILPATSPILGSMRPITAPRGRIPIYAAVIDDDGRSRVADVAFGFIRPPEKLEGVSGVVAIRVRQHDMAPMYRAGDTIFANPFGAPQPGSGVLLSALEGNVILIREFVSETSSEWVVRRYGDSPGVERIEKTDLPRLSVVEGILPGR